MEQITIYKQTADKLSTPHLSKPNYKKNNSAKNAKSQQRPRPIKNQQFVQQQYNLQNSNTQDGRQHAKMNYKNNSSRHNGYDDNNVHYDDYNYDNYAMFDVKPRNTQYNRVSPMNTKDYYNQNQYNSAYSTADCESPDNNLNEFRIVQSGKVIHDIFSSESEDSSPSELRNKQNLATVRFAAAVSSIGPNSKDISLPTFLEDF